MRPLKALALFLILILAGSIPAAEPKASLKGPAAVGVGDPILLSPAGSVSDAPVAIVLARGPSGASAEVLPLYTQDGRLVYGMASATDAGAYLFAAVARGTAEGSEREAMAFAFWEVKVGFAPDPHPPQPQPPAPGPIPPPVPPGPGPSSPPLVILAYETEVWNANVPAVVNSVEFRKYLDRVTAKVNGKSGWRAWDKDTDASREAPVLQSFWGAIRPSLTLDKLPAMFVSQGSTIIPLPWPKDGAAAIEALKPYGGP